ncbi:MAG: DUF2764 family protein [Treponemataceae bacterium]
MTYDAFFELCSRFLGEHDLNALQRLTLEPPLYDVKTGSALLDSWYTWERTLRVAVAMVRAQKMKKEFSDASISVTQDIHQIARTACGFDSPLEAEQYLNEERLKTLDLLSPIDGFCIDAIFAYGLKLQMACRIIQFNEQRGMDSYRTIYDQILGESK